MKKPIVKISFLFSVCGLLCLIVSLLLPSIKMTIFGSPEIFDGWQAIIWAVGLGMHTFKHVFTQHAQEDLKFVVLGVAGVLNSLFVAAPVIFLLYARRSILLFVFVGLSLFGILLAILTPFVLATMQTTVLIGYCVWMLGYVLLLVGIILVCKEVY